jgi:DNA-binding SARP family transcriptional activator
MTAPRGRVRGLLSALGLVLLVVGVPAVLARAFGWPLPRGVPGWSEITAALDDPSYIPDRVWIGAVAVVAWLGWAYVAAAVAVEVVARALHRPAPNVAIFARPVRELARRLVGSAALVTMLVGRPALAATPAAPTPAAVNVVATPAAPTQLAAVASVQPQAPGALPVYVVQPWEATRDCLWTIAERHLGDPLRWREIWELNRDRPQHDGRAFEEPDVILVGWELQLPADAVGIPAVVPEGTAGGPAPAAAAPTPAPSAPSAAASTTAAPTTAAPTTTAAPASTVATATARASVSGIPAPGPPRPEPTSTTATTSTRRQAAAPVIGLPAAAASVADAAPSGPSAEAPPPSPTAVDESAVADRKHGLATGAQLLGTGLLAAGVIATLDRLRRAQRRRRLAGERLPLPKPELAGVEWAARLGADASGAMFLELALRALVGALRGSGGDELPVVLAAQLGRRQLELVLAEPAQAPGPFQSRDGGRRWALPRSTSQGSLEELAAEAPSPAPGLVTVGIDGAGAEVLVDLEEIGLVSVVGDEGVARELVLAAGVQLGVNEWRDWVSVVLVGFPEAPLGLERVKVVGSLEEVLDDLEREAAETAELLADAELGSTFEARVAGLAEDVWIPTLVLCASALEPEEAERLAALATGPGNAGVGALVVGEAPGAVWELQVDVNELRIPQLGLTVRPQRLPEEEASALDELFEIGRRPLERARPGDVADEADDERCWGEPDGEPNPTGPLLARWGAPGDGEGPEPEEDDDAELDEVEATEVEEEGPAGATAGTKALVRLLGPLEIEVDGELVPLDRGKAREALAYLATHRRAPVDGDRLCEALWPGQDPRKKTGTFNTTMWFVRNALGATRLPKLRGRQRLYRLVADLVDVDYELLVAALRRARAERPEMARPLLRDALELVRGRPMEHVGKGHEWAFAEGLVYEMEAAVADAAHRLAELCLDAGDAEGAHWAVRQGLRGSPGNEQLYRDQMHAANAAGNPAGVEAAWDELCRMAEEEEPYDGLDPATVATHRELSRRAAS